ncbi:MAG TPA: hypothetical protein PK597_00445 [Oscillospiraceae bacterium]|nr:hypothetical protein [Oscillospiraceae bacterium]
MLLMLVLPYGYIFIEARSGGAWRGAGWICLALTVAAFVFNTAYAFLLAARGESGTALLLWDMILKLCTIPIYALVLLAGLALSIHGIIVLLPFFVGFDYLMLLASSMYGLNGLLLAHREKKITTRAVVVNGILHFIFCLDVVSAVVSFCMVKRQDKKQPVRP